MDHLGPAGTSPADAGLAMVVTRAGSQANRYSVELAEAVRALVRATAHEPAIPASELLVVLGHLHTAGYGLAQGLQQLAGCLSRSVEHGLSWAAGDDNPSEVADSAASAADAVDSITTAAEHATLWASFTERAQRQIGREARAVEARLARYYTTDRQLPLVDLPLMRLTSHQRRHRRHLQLNCHDNHHFC